MTSGVDVNGPIWAIGLMSGTSMDGIDAALIKTDGVSVDETGLSLSFPYDTEAATKIRSVLGRTKPDADTDEVTRLVTELHAKAVEELIFVSGLKRDQIKLVGFHGQTINHIPDQRFTWQLGDGQYLANLLGMPVVFDFRSDDVLAGGEGAPLAPVYHQALASQCELPVVFLNIGGVSNVTYLSEDREILAFDTGPGNAFMDDLVLARESVSFDENGRRASGGVVHREILNQLMDNPFFDRIPPKSLDRYDFDPSPAQQLETRDALATLAAFTVESIAASQQHFPQKPLQWFVCGGGRHNAYLMEMLAERLTGTVSPIEEIGFDGDMIEAQAFAFMAVRSAKELPISFPGTTNAPRPLTGGRLVYPNQTGC